MFQKIQSSKTKIIAKTYLNIHLENKKHLLFLLKKWYNRHIKKALIKKSTLQEELDKMIKTILNEGLSFSLPTNNFTRQKQRHSQQKTTRQYMVKLKDKIETLGLEKEIVADLHRLNIYTVRELWECQKKTLKENGFSTSEIAQIKVKLQLESLDLNKKKYKY